ncbi:hypothetical protein SKAU_G00048430 [Synaphobranchus kaupii]|uniref:Uncharacterized protein n=1 Tax=Synaphobranchus kaupii TaxID=118154 RepID=A0A9Q1G3C5_SYNKA|nr:hypothetical protein SKAU_G00048430 [Synaphobranchus kaupii]
MCRVVSNREERERFYKCTPRSWKTWGHGCSRLPQGRAREMSLLPQAEARDDIKAGLLSKSDVVSQAGPQQEAKDRPSALLPDSHVTDIFQLGGAALSAGWGRMNGGSWEMSNG